MHLFRKSGRCWTQPRLDYYLIRRIAVMGSISQRQLSDHLCECGCGERTYLATRTRPELGTVEGRPLQYCHGHRMRGTAKPLYRRLLDHILMPDEAQACWSWTGNRHTMGHGMLFYYNNGKPATAYAHRLAYEYFIGPIPKGLHVLHRCDNPPCCNPKHLFLGTQADNNADREAKGRGNHGWKLERPPHATLTKDTALAVYNERITGRTATDVGKQYGVSASTVNHIWAGKSWTHITHATPIKGRRKRRYGWWEAA